MKKQTVKKSSKPKQEKKTATAKKKATPKVQPEETPAEEPVEPQAKPEQPEVPTETPQDAAPQEQPATEAQPEVNPNDHLDIQQKERLVFKYGVRIAQEDLIGTKDEVAQKIADKTGDAVGEVRKFID